MSFFNIMLCYYFSLEVALHDMAKNNPTKIKRCRKLGNIKACACVKTHRKENIKFIVENCKHRFKF